jgi:signal transduction histidine kinase
MLFQPWGFAVVALVAIAAFAVFYWVRAFRRGAARRIAEKERDWQLQKARLEETVRHLRAASPKGEGLAGVAAEALHNMAQNLHGIHLSANLAEEQVEGLPSAFLDRIVTLLRENRDELGPFFAEGARGAMVVRALEESAARFNSRQRAALEELKMLHERVFKLNELLAAQNRFTLEGGELEILEPKKLVDDVLRVHAATMDELGVNVVREIEGVPPILGNRGLLMEVLHHLVQNAREALMSGESRDRRELIIKVVEKDKGRVRIEIIDNGMGIARENLTRIFAKGFTTKKNARGMGLHYCADTVSAMGCMIGVKSQGLGFGATFVLEIPTRPQGAENNASRLLEAMST